MTAHDRREDGAISIMAAVMALAVMLATALAVDVGRVAYVSRDQQGVTDRAALDAALELDGMPVGTPLSAVQPAVEAAVDAAMGRNPGSYADGAGTADNRQVIMVELGNVDGSRVFTVPDCSAAPCTVEDVTAVRVQVTSEVPFMFAIGATDDEDPGLNARRVTKEAVAETFEIATIQVGSALASLDQGLLDDTLDAVICQNIGGPSCHVSVDVLSYEGLIGATVSVGDLLTELGLSVGTAEEIMSTEVTAVDFLTAAAAVLGRDGDIASADVLNSIAAEMDGSATVTIGDLVDIATTNSAAVADADLDVFGLLVGTLQVANGTCPEATPMAACGNLINLPGLDLTVPGLLASTAGLQVVEAPRQAVGRAEIDPATGDWATIARTAQLRLRSETVIEGATVAGDLVAALDPVLGAVELGTPTVSNVNVPLSMNVAQSRSALTDIVCEPGGPGSLPNVTQQVLAGVARINVPNAVVATIAVPVTALGVNLGTLHVEVRGGATNVVLGAPASDTIEFVDGEYVRGPERVDSSGLGLGGLAATQIGLQANAWFDAASGLSSTPLIGATLIGLVDGILSSLDVVEDTVEVALQTAVHPFLQALNANVLDRTLEMLGTDVGAADVWAIDADCQQRRLAAIAP